jgi:hypothetical protein
MLQIRREQTLELQNVVLELAALDRARRFFPAACDKLGDRLWPLVQRSVRRARRHGFASQSDALQFVFLVLALGEGFDREMPWATSLLNETEPAKRAFLARRLYEAAMRHLRASERDGAEGSSA